LYKDDILSYGNVCSINGTRERQKGAIAEESTFIRRRLGSGSKGRWDPVDSDKGRAFEDDLKGYREAETS
jgi:hypothetical protein